MSTIPLLASNATNAEGSQIIGTVNGVIQNINANALIGSVAPTSLRNILIGSDFNTNPWQRGTSFTAIANTATYTADRWAAVGGASSSINVSQQTSSPVPGFGAQLQFGRGTGSNTAVIKLISVVETNDVYQMQGLPFVLSFYAIAGANFSAANNTLALQVTTGTDTNSGLVNFIAGSWTGQANATLYNSAGSSVTSVALTGSWARYAVSGVIPTTATELAVQFSYTPVGTAGANDWFQIEAIQLEVMPQGGNNPTPFERRQTSLELQLCQRYAQAITVPAKNTNAQYISTGIGVSATVANFAIPIKVPFRAAPITNIASIYPTSKAGGFVVMGPKNTFIGSALLTQVATSQANFVEAKATVSGALSVKTGSPAILAMKTPATGSGVQILMSAEL